MQNSPITVYDKLETNFNSYGLAVITTAIDPGPRIYERMNAEYTCEFSVPYSDPAVEYLQAENVVKIENQLFFIRNTSKARDDEGRLIAAVFAEHVTTELLTEFIDELIYNNATPQAIIDGVLNGTRFTANATALPGTHDFTIDREYASWGVNHLLALSDGEMKRNNFDITFKPEIGSDNGVRISYRKNMRSIKRSVESRGVITRLFVWGKDGLVLDDPIDSPNIGMYPRPKCGDMTFDNIDNTEDLEAAGAAYLDTVDTPAVTYECEVVELKNSVGWDESEGFQLGDTVHIDDKDLGILVTARIVEYEYFPQRPDNSRVTLANFVPDISDSMAGIDKSVKVIDRVTTGGGNIKSSYIEGAINVLKNQLIASGSYATSDVLEGKGFILENNNISSPDYGALYLGPGVFAIANEKIAGAWNWRTFGKGKGFTADEINAGIIRASVIRIETDGSAYMDGLGFHVDSPTGEVVRMGEYEPGKFGVITYHTDGSRTILTPDGLVREKAGTTKPYNYLVASGSADTGSTGNYFDSGGARYASGLPNGAGIPNVTIQLPDDFKGKDFADGISISVMASVPYEMSQRDNDNYYVPYIDLGPKLEVVSVNSAAGTFTVKGYGSHFILNSGDGSLYQKYWAITFSYVVVS